MAEPTKVSAPQMMKKGRQAAARLEIIGPLTEEKLQTGVAEGPSAMPQGAAAVKKIKHSHHQLARLLAEGYSQIAAARAAGYSPSRVNILRRDPAFKELVNYYSAQLDEAYADLHGYLAGLGMDSVQELKERLEESPEDMSAKMLLQIAQFAADRTGHGPTRNHNVSGSVNVETDKAEFQKVKEQVRGAEPVDVIDVTPGQGEGEEK